MAKPKIAAAPTFKNGMELASFEDERLLIDDKGVAWIFTFETGMMAKAEFTEIKKEHD